jgi:zinc protease
LDRLLGDLPATGAPPGTAPWLLTAGGDGDRFPDAAVDGVFGQLGIPRDDPDFFPAFILNEAMGGGASPPG